MKGKKKKIKTMQVKADTGKGKKKKNKTMQVKAETGKGKKKRKKRNNRLAFILRRQWVGKWIPAKTRAGLSHWAGNNEWLWFCRPCGARLAG